MLGIFGKRRVDLTDDDAAVMARVVGIVRRERGDDLDPTSSEDQWRRGLMSIGHDPLQAPRA